MHGGALIQVIQIILWGWWWRYSMVNNCVIVPPPWCPCVLDCAATTSVLWECVAEAGTGQCYCNRGNGDSNTSNSSNTPSHLRHCQQRHRTLGGPGRHLPLPWQPPHNQHQSIRTGRTSDNTKVTLNPSFAQVTLTWVITSLIYSARHIYKLKNMCLSSGFEIIYLYIICLPSDYDFFFHPWKSRKNLIPI